MNNKYLFKIFQLFGIVLGIGGLILAIYSGYVLFFTVNNITFNGILFGVGIVLLLLGLLMVVIPMKKSKNICQKCGHSLKGCAYSWQLVRLYSQYSNQIAQYKVTAVCPKCGRERVFNQDFVVSDYQNQTTTNPQMMIEEWCKNKFGH